MGPGILPETTVGKHNLQMPTKALSCKKEAICEHGPEAPSCPVGQGSFKIESKFDILVGNHGRRVLRAKEERDLPACYQRSVQKMFTYYICVCTRAAGLIEGDSHAHLVSKDGSVISSKSPSCAFRRSGVYYTEP